MGILLRTLVFIGLICFAILFNAVNAFAQSRYEAKIVGKVYDNSISDVLSLANIYVEETQQSTRTDAKGAFEINLGRYSSDITVVVTYIGKKMVKQKISRRNFNHPISIILVDNSLTLEKVDVNPNFEGTRNSISSITFDEEAIERVQAFSLIDVLNNLPGKQITAPNINGPQTLTLRNTLDRSDAINNSLGIPIIMDGVAISNDANMQSRLVGQRGMGSTGIPSTGGARLPVDVPFTGIDLREIPVESIEKIEVIQGVASAEYGELTDGAILIERKAGKSPWHFTTNINAGARNFSLNKGVNLPKKWGGLTIDGNYAISNSEPTDRFQEYRRYGLGVRWNTVQYKYFRNKLSLDFNQRLDEVKLDPDDNADKRFESKESGIRISNNTSILINKSWLDDINVVLSYSERNQESFAQMLLNRGPIPIGGRDTTGIYEGIYIDGRYLSEEQIIGRPVTASANIRLTTRFKIGDASHVLSYGANANYSNNGGRGMIADPARPRFINFNGQNLRPYPFELTPSILNSGIYLTDNMRYRWFGKAMNSSLGVRFDSQNGSLSIQPRLNTQIVFNKKWQAGLGFGVATKSPTLLHRYPPPTWIDIPLGNVMYNDTYLYLLHTERVELTTPNLKPNRSMQAEFTVNYRNEFITSRFNGFFKHATNGFQSVNAVYPITLPNFSFSRNQETGKIEYEETGEYTKHFAEINKIENRLSSYSYGFDWTISTKKIDAIQTSFLTSTSFILSQNDNGELVNRVRLSSPVDINGAEIWHALYRPTDNDQRYILTSKLNSTTHIPKLGFVVMANADVFWMNKLSSLHKADTQPAVGYLDEYLNPVYLTSAQQIAGIIPPRDLNRNSTEQRIVYANLSLSVAKEIGKKIRIAVTAYNAFNLRPVSSFIDPNSGQENTIQYNSPVSVTGGVAFRL
ncbi:carboxypeptidase-like regulatory domain-containing protein [Sphingobacterium corticis]|uniref:Carboxypeptidase-like regulatory domain-containing protein n=1 Tax=Sphingobacterium corticis TaxID=1812823 RepID=A0ABW5NIQ7_9SPHI